MTIDPIHVIGGGLAGSEAAWQIAQAGVPVILPEMRPQRGTGFHLMRAILTVRRPSYDESTARIDGHAVERASCRDGDR